MAAEIQGILEKWERAAGPDFDTERQTVLTRAAQPVLLSPDPGEIKRIARQAQEEKVQREQAEKAEREQEKADRLQREKVIAEERARLEKERREKAGPPPA